MEIALLVILLLVVAGVLWRRLRSRRETPAAARRAAPPNTPYRCVSISTGLNACRAAERTRGKRFLPREAPVLPLQGCSEKQCSCRYVHHADRRTDDRRDTFSHFEGLKPTPDQDDKRRGWDRRRGDS